MRKAIRMWPLQAPAFVSGACSIFERRKTKCGSGGATIRLARESGVSVHINVVCESAFASKSNRRTAAPTLGLWWVQLPRLLVICFKRLPSKRRYWYIPPLGP